ncbi:MAG: hypothetical protein IJL77_03505 [Clostridia bacterium]|nr:hypothetical protein [Clostridia bacterium]
MFSVKPSAGCNAEFSMKAPEMEIGDYETVKTSENASHDRECDSESGE